jgi:hypothetical protein
MVSVVDVVLITAIGAAFGVPFPTRWPAIAVVLVLGAACFCALGEPSTRMIPTPVPEVPDVPARPPVPHG